MIRYGWLLVAVGGLVFASESPSQEAATKEMDQLQGYWEVVSAERSGVKGTDAETKKLRLIFTGNKLSFSQEGKGLHDATYKTNPSQKPATIDVTHVTGPYQGRTFPGIYTLEGDELKICWDENGMQRPTEFTTKPKTGHSLLTLKRTKA